MDIRKRFKKKLRKIFKFTLEVFCTAGIFVIGKEISDSYLCGTIVGILQIGGLMIEREIFKYEEGIDE